MWAQSTIGQILKNRAYLGEATCTIGNEQFWQETIYPAILTKEEFEMAQHKGKSKKHMEPHISAPLVGKVICAECRRSMVRSAHDSCGKEIVSFWCRTSTVLSESSCFRGAVLETDIETSVRQRVLEYSEELRKKLTNLKDLLIEKSISLEQQEIQLKKEIETIEKHRIQALEARRMNDMSQEAFDKCCYDSAEAIEKCKERMRVAEDEYKKLYGEHSEVERNVKKYRFLLRSENFMERVLAENKIEIIIDATGGSSVKI